MAKFNSLNPLAAGVGAALVASAMTATPVNAAENPFATNALTAGYELAAHHESKAKEGNCGEGMKSKEGKCGENMKSKEGNCGENMKSKEGNCGENMKAKEGNCGEGMKAKKEGKCGEGKCGK